MTFFLQLTKEICPLWSCWIYPQLSTRSIMKFFCSDWSLRIRSLERCIYGSNPTCSIGVSTCVSVPPHHHRAQWCAVYLRDLFLEPYYFYSTAVTFNGS